MMTRQKRALGAANTERQRRKDDAAGVFSYENYSTERGRRQWPAHGQIKGRAWVKRVRKSAHMLRHPYGWAVDVADLDAAERCGADYVELREQEERRVYRATFAALRARGVAIDRGCGAQIALPMGYWVIDGKEPAPAAHQQLALFGGHP